MWVKLNWEELEGLVWIEEIKGFGEAGRTTRESQLDIWLGNNLKEYKWAEKQRYKAMLGHLGAWGVYMKSKFYFYLSYSSA